MPEDPRLTFSTESTLNQPYERVDHLDLETNNPLRPNSSSSRNPPPCKNQQLERARVTRYLDTAFLSNPKNLSCTPAEDHQTLDKEHRAERETSA